jgi:anaerobic magnesium-protoporphyrin IX monomethyl ester cyclase
MLAGNRMDVLLVNPRHKGKSEVPPLGLQCLAGSLRASDISTAILDLDVCPYGETDQSLIEAVQTGKPRIVGVSVLSDSLASAMGICRLVKSLNTGILTVLGGIHASVMGRQVLETYPQVDIIVRGEGEITFLELVRRYLNLVDYSDIDGISFRHAGGISENRERSLERDLDRFPLPDRSLLDISLYPTHSVSSSRGCRRHCTFCSIQSLYHNTIRVRNPKSLIREIGEMASLGVRKIMFTDDNFTFSLKRLREICGLITDRRLDRYVEFYAEGCLEDICRNPLITQILGQSGFRAIYAGAESGSPEILKRYGKNLSPEDVLKGASYCLMENVMPVLNFILLGPWDTVDTVRQTIDLAKQAFENGADIAYAEMLIPYPGTPIQEELVRDGKFRQRDNVFYFESYEGISVEWFLRTCDLARDLAKHSKGDESFFESRKNYYELKCLGSLLEGEIPEEFRCRSDGREVENLERKIEDLLMRRIGATGGIIPV